MEYLRHFPLIISRIKACYAFVPIEELIFTWHSQYALVFRLIDLCRPEPVRTENENGIHKRMAKCGKLPVKNRYHSGLCRMKHLFLSVRKGALFLEYDSNQIVKFEVTVNNGISLAWCIISHEIYHVVKPLVSTS